LKKKKSPKRPKTRKASPRPRKTAKILKFKASSYPLNRPFLEKELWMIHEVASLMRQGLTYYEALKLVLKCVAGAAKSDRVEIYLLEEKDRTLVREIAIDRQGRYETGTAVKIQLGTNFPDPFSRLVYGKAEYVSDQDLSGKKPVQAVRSGTFNVKVPIKASGKVLGVLSVDYKGREHPKSKAEVLALLTFATQVGFILENIRLHFDIVQLAFKDDLTGQYNYRFWIKRLREEVDRANRYQHSFTLLVVGLDKFSKFNETYGFTLGDRVLRDLGFWIKRNLRACDLVARLGGDQFGLMLPETKLEGAKIVAEKLRKGIEAFEYPADPGLKEIRAGLTASIGLVEYPSGALMLEQLVEKGSRTLHEAKAGGGNKLAESPALQEAPPVGPA